MEDLIAKARRLKSPKSINIAVRPEVYEWLTALATAAGIKKTQAARAVIEDSYDRYCASALIVEVPGDE